MTPYPQQPSADQGFFEAQYNVGNWYCNGTGVEQSDSEACEYYKLAADQGHRSAQYNLGCMYLKGRGVMQVPQSLNYKE